MLHPVFHVPTIPEHHFRLHFSLKPFVGFGMVMYFSVAGTAQIDHCTVPVRDLTCGPWENMMRITIGMDGT